MQGVRHRHDSPEAATVVDLLCFLPCAPSLITPDGPKLANTVKTPPSALCCLPDPLCSPFGLETRLQNEREAAGSN